MKKGQKVRVIENGKVGTIVDSTFFVLKGMKKVMYQVQIAGQKKEACWYPAEKLGGVVEECTAVVTDESGKGIAFTFKKNYSTKNIDVECSMDTAPETGVLYDVMKFMLIGIKNCSRRLNGKVETYE
ncbi:MAG: hypothetical protein IJZ86_01155 [Bacteroides sp.]|nr:hypothetical protein [Bacteroides sp.]